MKTESFANECGIRAKAFAVHDRALSCASPKNGYFFLDREGLICEAKFASGNWEDNACNWRGQPLGDWLLAGKSSLHALLEGAFASGRIRSGELIFQQADCRNFLGLDVPLHAQAHAIADDVNHFCLLVVLDDRAHGYAEAKVKRAKLRHPRKLLKAAMDGFWLMDEYGFLKAANQAYANMSGYAVDELVGMNIGQLEMCVEPGQVDAHISELKEAGQQRYETQHRRSDGSLMELEVSASYLPESREIFAFCHDIGQRKQNEQALRIVAATFETQDATLITDAQCNIIRVNRAFTEITGYAPEDVIGKNPRILSSGRESKAFYAEMWKCLLEQGCWAGEIWDRRKNGDIYLKWLTITAIKNEAGEVAQYVAIFSDITVRKQKDEQIRQMAFYDALTKLPNRHLLNERLAQTLNAGKRSGFYGAVMFLDLDNFKPLNDIHGHVAGDSLLVEVAGRLKRCVREVDTVARFGGDEFVVMIGELSADLAGARLQALKIAEKIRIVLSEPYFLTVQAEAMGSICIEHFCSVSIGVVVFANHQGSLEDILMLADVAMYQAKESGRNRIKFSDCELVDR